MAKAGGRSLWKGKERYGKGRGHQGNMWNNNGVGSDSPDEASG